MSLLVAAMIILVGTGLFALVANGRPRIAAGVAAGGAVAAGLVGAVPVIEVLRGGKSLTLTVAWQIPSGAVALGLDPLSAFFLVPLLVLGALCAVYGCFYLRSYERRRAMGPPAFFFNLTLAAMLLILLARGAVILLFAWELMTLGSYLLITFQHEEAEVRRAGWVFLIAGHVGILALTVFVLILGRHAGGLGFADFVAHPAAGGFAALVLVLATIAFGIKAGVVPLHVWLPEAHAAAPSHVSALMSGILIKAGLYGILRTLTFLAPMRLTGPLLIALGVLGGLLGISLALGQRDMKRALAYSTIENVGVMLIGFGLGCWAARGGHPRIAALGFCGGLLHLWNHAVMKGLMFLAAGSVLHGAGSKDLERLGGLLGRMRWTGSALILGAVAIAGLPPLNGFASEWLIYMGLLDGGLQVHSGAGLLLLFVTAILTTIGVLAGMCFVRLGGIAVLGQPRSSAAATAHESSRGMVVPLLLLAAGCVALAPAAQGLAPVLARVASQVLGGPIDLAPVTGRLGTVATFSAVIWLALLLTAMLFFLLTRRRRAADDTWACGYAAPTTRMQYTALSFAEIMAERLLPPILRTRVTLKGPRAIFAEATRISSNATDPMTRTVYEPFFGTWARRFARLRWLQQGSLHIYIFYMLALLIGALAWTSVRRWLGAE